MDNAVASSENSKAQVESFTDGTQPAHLEPTHPNPPSSLNRQILNLALPALGALIAEPLLITIDSAMVGHLGTAPLAGLALASTVLTTAVGIYIFLAYSTTAIASRALGEKAPQRAMQAGIDAIWLAAILGALTATVLIAAAHPITQLFHPTDATLPHAIAYLKSSSPGIVGMCIVLAATGTLRGTLDTKTPLYVAAVGAAINAALNALLIYGFQWGIAGSGAGTAITQTLMAITLVAIIVKRAHRYHLRWHPDFRAIGGAAITGSALLVRTLTLRLAFLLTVWAATRSGTIALAAYQVSFTIWTFSAYLLDALGISAQALLGYALGSGDPHRVRQLVRRIITWGIGVGVLIGLTMALTAPILPGIFGPDPQMHHAARTALIIGGLCQVIAGYVYMLDGILIGAGDNRFLAIAGTINLVVYVPLLLATTLYFTPTPTTQLSAITQTQALAAIWLCLGIGFMGMRALTTGWRVRGERWMHLPNPR